ncbi:phospholipase D [Thelonectria olida]|uniref:Phospholipase D n=1 Tax=Thelonectria olida TaxID=1576542 RepID=A0A9P9AJV2_9HYPO|nr:phospholipase D [Thelonectria olida]
MPAFSYFMSGLYAATLLLASPLVATQHNGQLTQDAAHQPPVGDLDTTLEVRASKKPFYAIAHRCNNVGAIQRAVDDGANAIEMDLYAEETGWWASHDGPSKNGDKARVMFNAVAGHRKAGKPITFVWLDIKNPDWCDPGDPKWWFCSIAALRDLAREVLEPQGVRVLFGFYENANGNGYRLIRHGLNGKEAVNIDGRAAPLRQEFTANGPADVSKRILSYGDVNLPNGFGDCSEPGDAHLTCTQLRQATEFHAFGKVFGWTATTGQGWYTDKLLGVGVDGIIYGLGGGLYGGSVATQAAKELRGSLAKYSGSYYLAGKDDFPW